MLFQHAYMSSAERARNTGLVWFCLAGYTGHTPLPFTKEYIPISAGERQGMK
jgi:hypothetical protein